ncbi:pentatricopeptide repeat-containing protein At1g79490, mitochondrial-like [Triticum dicoccoides]|uniref:pentatricopeptide repeat-containing protein At1g79490, mitochondrial-like n=1 Tax=Triticum dicoccoides TaxID=85692 RepID=UPI000E7C601A|nr:pentatricopeptide repeat-containing protein At1g79490, mitochondrial-like [Triticum dicoccoides]
MLLRAGLPHLRRRAAALPLSLAPRRLSSDPPPSVEWIDTVDYLDETGEVLSSAPGARPAVPGADPTILSGSSAHPLPRPAAAARIAALALRHRSGPALSAALSALPSQPDPALLLLAANSLPASDPTPLLSLVGWARHQPWFVPSDDLSFIVAARLSPATHSSDLMSLFDDALLHPEPASFPKTLNAVVSALSTHGLLEPAFYCFKRLRDAGFHGLQTPTYNALLSLLLARGLAFKAFEVLDEMSVAGCDLDKGTYELAVPALARAGRIDASRKLFDEMRQRDGVRPASPGVYSTMVDVLAKSGRLDAAMGMYREMVAVGHRVSTAVSTAMLEGLVKAGKLDAGMELWEEMQRGGLRPSFGLYTMVVEANARSGRLDVAAKLFGDMEKSGFFPTPATYACLVEMHASAGNVDVAMRMYHSMANAGTRPGLSTFTALLTMLANKKLLDLAAKVLLEMKASGFPIEVTASDLLMIYIKDGSTELALRWLRFMGSAGIRTNNFIIRQLFESCMKMGLYDSARPLLETYVGAAAKVDMILYTSILAHLVRCQDEDSERAIMNILRVSRHKAHDFMCGLFTGPEQRKKPVLSFVREFFQGIDYENEESAARYFVNVLLNYLVLMGQMNRARCVWKVAYENKLFPKAIVFDQHIAWSLDIRNLSVGAALVSTVHTLHRFRKRMLYYGVVPRRIKLVTGPTLKMVVAQVLASLESPFEVSKVVLRAPGDSVLEWFKKPIVQQFLLNEIPSKSDVLMHKLNVMFPSSAPEARSLALPRSLGMSR